MSHNLSPNIRSWYANKRRQFAADLCPMQWGVVYFLTSLYSTRSLIDSDAVYKGFSPVFRRCMPGKHEYLWSGCNSEFVRFYYPRDAMLARVIEIATCLSVRLSVCPSVTRRYCVKTKKASRMISSPSGSPKTLVFWRQISSPNSKGFPPNGSLKQGLVGKI